MIIIHILSLILICKTIKMSIMRIELLEVMHQKQISFIIISVFTIPVTAIFKCSCARLLDYADGSE